MTTLTIRQLKAVASRLKIKGYSNLRKAELIEAINLHLDAKAQVQHGECCSIDDHPFAFDREELQDMVLENAIPLAVEESHDVTPPTLEENGDTMSPIQSHPFAIYAIAFLIVLLETIGIYTTRKAIQLLTWLANWYAAQVRTPLGTYWKQWREVNMALD